MDSLLAGPPRRLPTPVIDVVTAVGGALAICVVIGAAQESGSKEPGVLAYVLGVAIAAPLLARRRRPVAVLAASAVLLLVYYAFDYPGIGVAVPLAPAVYSAVAAGYRSIALVVTGLLELSAILYRALAEDESLVSVVGLGTVADLSLLAAVILLAEALRSRRALQAETRERLLALERERERLAERRVEQERLRIARELHDILAHTVAVINVHAAVAADGLDDDPDQVRASLTAIREESREAIGQLKAALGVLRDGGAEAPLAPVPRLSDLDRLVASLGVEGPDVEISIAGEPRPLASEVELTAYRVAQESLTNVVRHANAGSVSIELSYVHEALLLTICDDGRGGPVTSPADRGHGLAGMRERVQAIGGSIDAGRVPGNGFRVQARLPTARSIR